MDGLPSSILPTEARFAHVASAVQLADIYVPFVDPTSVSSDVVFARQREADPGYEVGLMLSSATSCL
jgi:hypothetical protein